MPHVCYSVIRRGVLCAMPNCSCIFFLQHMPDCHARASFTNQHSHIDDYCCAAVCFWASREHKLNSYSTHCKYRATTYYTYTTAIHCSPRPHAVTRGKLFNSIKRFGKVSPTRYAAILFRFLGNELTKTSRNMAVKVNCHQFILNCELNCFLVYIAEIIFNCYGAHSTLQN